jgi:PAS domain S-box-containing protein
MERRAYSPELAGHLAAIVQSSDDAIVSKDLDGTIVSWNSAAERMFGYAPEEAIGRSIRIIIPPDRQDEEDEVLRRVRNGEKMEHFETVRRRRDGSLIEISLTVSPIQDAAGRIVGASKIARDISETRRIAAAERAACQAAEEAAARIARLQAVTAALSEAVTPAEVAEAILTQGLAALGAATGIVAALDEAGRELEIIGAHGYPAELVAAWRRFSVDAKVPASEAVRRREPVLVESMVERLRRFPGAYGEREGGALAALPLVVGGRIVGAIGVVFEQERGFDEPELADLSTVARLGAQALDRARLHALEQRGRRQAELASRAKDEFLATLSHELRSPLAPILQGVEMIRLRGEDGSFRARTVERVERQALRMARLLDDLLDFSRIAHGKIELRETWVELGTLVRHAAESCEAMIEKRRHRLALDLPDEPSWLVGDPSRLEQALCNLITNAVKYTPEGGQIRLSAQAEGDEVEVRVADNGVGIAPEQLGRIFDLFHQGGDPPREGPEEAPRPQGAREGLGIGLALTRKLVELHGGEIEARSAGPGRGSEFVVRLPRLAGRPRPAAATAAQAPADLAPAEPGKRSLRILVVEDNVDHATLLADLLELWGNEVRVAHDGAAAVEEAARLPPDLVLLDIGLPDMDGYEVAAALRGSAATSAARLVALTGYGDPGDVERARAAGMDLHLVKPVAPAELRSFLAALVVPEI